MGGNRSVLKPGEPRVDGALFSESSSKKANQSTKSSDLEATVERGGGGEGREMGERVAYHPRAPRKLL